MLRSSRAKLTAGGVLCLVALAGCAAKERAFVEFSYVVKPSRGLPMGMRNIAIMPAKVGPATDPKWSDLCVNIMQTLVNESRTEFGADVEVSDRRDTQVTFDEADLAAAGMSTRQGGSGGKLLEAQGVILSNINVKVEKHVGRQRTLSGISLAGGGGHGWGAGGGSVQTREVETVTRSMTVQTAFKLVDAGNNKVWEHYTPKTFLATDRTKASPIFGSSRTEADLTPQDEIIGALVEKGAREFISRLMPCRINVEAAAVSSSNKACIQGVRLLRAEAFDEALSNFKIAMMKNPNDHQAAFGAGAACEASGRYEEARKYYNRACGGQDDPKYRQARDRIKAYGDRIQ